MVLELVMFRIITDLAQNCVVLKLGSEGSVPEMVKKMMVQFLIQEGGQGESDLCREVQETLKSSGQSIRSSGHWCYSQDNEKEREILPSLSVRALQTLLSFFLIQEFLLMNLRYISQLLSHKAYWHLGTSWHLPHGKQRQNHKMTYRDHLGIYFA